MKFYNIMGCLLLSFFWACNSSHSSKEAHAHNDITIPYTGYSSEVEVFADVEPLATGTNSDLIVHLTDLATFKPIDIQQLTVSLVVGSKGVRVVSDSPVQKGIFIIRLQPVLAGSGQLQFTFNKDGREQAVVVNNVLVYEDAHQAMHLAEEDLPSSPNAIGFAKEQSWKVEFETRPVQRLPFNQIIKAPAKVEAAQDNQTLVVAKTSGVVQFSAGSLYPGQSLSKGDWTMTIAGEGLTENNAVVRLQEARAEYEAAKSDYNRDKRLFEQQIVSERALLESKARFEKAGALWNNLQKSVGQSGENVLAPQMGLVHSVYVSNGEFITTGTPLYSIVENKRLMLQAMVRQSQLPALAAITDATIELNSGEVFELKELNGTIKAVAQTVNEEAYLLPVTIEVDYDERLVSGGFVSVYLKRAETVPALVVPETALVEIQGLYFVYLQLTPEMFERQQVKVGASNGVQRVILSGLREHDRVVTKGAILVKLAAVSNTIDAHAGHVH